jgi:hypothetical protein
MSKDVSKVRKANARKAITAEIRALRKIEAAIAKAKDAIALNSEVITGDTYEQIVQVFAQLNVAITVTDSAVQDKAHKLAQTFVK